jgi:hypothetical protein
MARFAVARGRHLQVVAPSHPNLGDQGGEPSPMSPKGFADFSKAESVQFERIVTTAKIVAE